MSSQGLDTSPRETQLFWTHGDIESWNLNRNAVISVLETLSTVLCLLFYEVNDPSFGIWWLERKRAKANTARGWPPD